jgi:hypothetical protein
MGYTEILKTISDYPEPRSSLYVLCTHGWIRATADLTKFFRIRQQQYWYRGEMSRKAEKTFAPRRSLSILGAMTVSIWVSNETEQLFFSFFGGTGAWTQGLHIKPLHQPYFCEGFFKIGSQELFAWAGFEPRSSWSLVYRHELPMPEQP